MFPVNKSTARLSLLFAWAAHLGWPDPSLSAVELENSAKSYAVLHSLPPGTTKPGGWLDLYLNKQIDGLGSKLIEVSWPFCKPYWAGEEGGKSWWPWEQQAYWIDGATRLALAAEDTHMYAKAGSFIRYTLNSPAEDGYLGPKTLAPPDKDFNRWPHAIFFRSLMALADSNSPLITPPQRQEIASALKKHYLSAKASYGTPRRNVTNIEAMLWCYAKTGDPQLLTLAEQSWNEYLTKADSGEYGDLGVLRVMAATPINAHGVTYSETSKQPAILYLYTGKKEYLDFALAAQRRVFDHHMLIDGTPSTTEWYRTVTALDSHETCDIADQNWTWHYMLMATGDALWADCIEKACLNAGMGAIKKDWKGVQYFSCPNQFLATRHSNHNVLKPGNGWMAYQPNPGEKTACCGGNAHRIFPNYVLNMWMREGKNGLAAVFYGASKLKANVGMKQSEVEIEQITDYPFDDQINFKIISNQPIAFPLSLRIPRWCATPSLKVNGSPVEMPERKDGFVRLNRTFNSGDTVTLSLPMRVKVSTWPQNGVGIEYGPLVYSLPIKEKWTPYISPEFSTEEYPGWEATPESSWNFGAITDRTKVNSGISVEKDPIRSGQDPWVDPPVKLVLPARRIENWQLLTDPANPERKFTPPLPQANESKVSPVVENVALVPYGSTHLRLTIFPNLRTEL